MIQFDNAIKRFNQLILSELTEHDIKCWIAGGAVRDYFMGNRITTDYDIFFPNEIEFNKTKLYMTSQSATVKWESDNGCKMYYNGHTFDLVKKYFKDPNETIYAFDFTVSMFAISNTDVFFGPSSFIDLAKKQLMINKITYPASTLSRSFRYYTKGFTMCKGEMKKLFEAIQKHPIENIDENSEVVSNSNEITSFDRFFSGID